MESLCAAQNIQCDKERSSCTDTSGIAYCQCQEGYYKHNPDDLSCLGKLFFIYMLPHVHFCLSHQPERSQIEKLNQGNKCLKMSPVSPKIWLLHVVWEFDWGSQKWIKQHWPGLWNLFAKLCCFKSLNKMSCFRMWRWLQTRKWHLCPVSLLPFVSCQYCFLKIFKATDASISVFQVHVWFWRIQLWKL